VKTQATRIAIEKTPLRAKDPVAPALEAGLGFRLGRLARHLRREWAQELKPLGLSPPQAAVVRGVAAEPGCSLRGLARTLDADPMNVKRYVDELEQRALIRTGNLTTDRRSRVLLLTEAGENVAHDIARLVDTQQHWLTGSMSPEEARNLGVGLARLEARLGIGVVERSGPLRRRGGSALGAQG